MSLMADQERHEDSIRQDERERIAALVLSNRPVRFPDKVSQCECEGLSEYHGGGCLHCFAEDIVAAIRNGEHRTATEPPKAQPLRPEQVAKVKAYKDAYHKCTCLDAYKRIQHTDPQCHGCTVAGMVEDLCDGTFLEPVAAGGEEVGGIPTEEDDDDPRGWPRTRVAGKDGPCT